MRSTLGSSARGAGPVYPARPVEFGAGSVDLIENYPRYEHLLASIQLALAMLGMGALLGPRDFGRVARSPRALCVGLLLQLVLVPGLAFVLGRVLPLEMGLAAGFVLVASVPGGTMSNLVTYLGRGNIALSISLTAVTTVGALATTPALLRLLVGAARPSSGRVLVDDRDLAELSAAELRGVRARSGFVHQDHRLVPNQRVSTNVLAGRLGRWSFLRSLRELHFPGSQELAQVHALLERAGIPDKLFQRVDALSGGEQQRVHLGELL